MSLMKRKACKIWFTQEILTILVLLTGMDTGIAQDQAKRIENAAKHPFFGGNITTIGWEGDKDAVMLKNNGWFWIRDSLNSTATFHISAYPGRNEIIEKGKVKWYPHSGYLPCFITDFYDNWEEFGPDDQMHVKISNFADKVTIDGNNFVVVYSRVSVTNHMKTDISPFPGASANLIPLNSPNKSIVPGGTVNYDYAIVADRFGNSYSRPSAEKIKAAGSWDLHFEHMRNHWESRLSSIVDIRTPDNELNNAYKMGFIYTLIARDGSQSYNVAEIGYDVLFNHDYLGIYHTLLKLGFYDNAYNQLKLMGEGRGPYHDHYYRWSLPLSLYLLKTGDVGILEKENGYLYNKCKEAYEITISDIVDSTGLIGRTWDIDADGMWTWDDESALTGFTTLAYVARLKGDKMMEKKAKESFNRLNTSVNRKIGEMQQQYGIDYIPASLEAPNEKIENIMKKGSSFWATPFWFGMNWNTYLAGGEYEGLLKNSVDNTFKWGLDKQAKEGFKPHNFGTWVSYGGGVASAYNSAFAISGLFSENYRQETIKSYQFLLEYGQSAPYGFWEMFHDPDPGNTWEGNHPSMTQTNWFACPHQWGQAGASQALLDALVAEFYDGRILVGRGYPDEWMKPGKITEIRNYPISNNQRMNLKIEALSENRIKLSWSGDKPVNHILFNLPQFKENIEFVSNGIIDQEENWVVVEPTQQEVVVTLGKN